MLRFFSALLVMCLTFNAHAADSYITRLLNKPVPGGVAVIELGTGPQAPKATYQGKPVLVVKEQNTWRAIVGIPLTVKPGNQHISSGGRDVSFNVGSKKYPEQHITLKNKRQVNPNPADIKRIDNELAIQIKAYRTFSPNIPSNLLLDKPVNGPLSSKFGVRRFFNGNTVVVDHGQGFISMFCHMSKIDTRVGQHLARGDVVGKVGSTGRATGPHMHWNVSLNDARVDPAIFIGAFQP